MSATHCIFPAVPGGAPTMWPSIAPVSARWHDSSEFIEIEIHDGLQGRSGGRVAETVRHGVAPGGIFGLQGEYPRDRVVPAL